MYQMDFRGLYKSVMGASIQVFVRDVNIQRYVYM